MKMKLALLPLLLLLSLPVTPSAGQGSRLVYSQLRFNGDWDPYPGSFSQIRHYLENTASIKLLPERRVIEIMDDELFYSPFLVFTGRGSFPGFSEEETERLRRYIEGGGLILIDTASDSEFEAAADRAIERAQPGSRYEKIPTDHAVYRAFYLVSYVSGRRLSSPYLEGITSGSRTAVIKVQNDLLGIWPRDTLGNWRYSLVPGRHDQRKEAIKLTLNILMYSVSGTYKSDPVHQPYIREKLGR